MTNLEIYCITHKKLDLIEKLELIPFGVGNFSYPSNYLSDNSGINIANKNINYGDMTFHYWYWKNRNPKSINKWIGVSQYRRFFTKLEFRERIVNSNLNFNIFPEELNNILIKKLPLEWDNFDVVLCDPIDLSNVKFSKLFKRGFRSIVKDPSIIFNKNKRTLKLHFDMHCGHGNLAEAAKLLNNNDRNDFIEYCNNETSFVGANSCFFVREKILDHLYPVLFQWLFRCEEEIFKYKDINNEYGLKRIYTFLAERFIPFWFRKYYKTITWPWIYYDLSLENFSRNK